MPGRQSLISLPHLQSPSGQARPGGGARLREDQVSVGGDTIARLVLLEELRESPHVARLQRVHLGRTGRGALLHGNRRPHCGRDGRRSGLGSPVLLLFSSLGTGGNRVQGWRGGQRPVWVARPQPGTGRERALGQDCGAEAGAHRRCGWARGRAAGGPGGPGTAAGPRLAADAEPPASSAPTSSAGSATAGRAHSPWRRQALGRPQESMARLTPGPGVRGWRHSPPPRPGSPGASPPGHARVLTRVPELT